MKTLYAFGCSLALLLASTTFAVETAQRIDITRGVPASAHMAVHGRHNPERDYQLEHFGEVWQTLQEEKLGEKFLNIITSRMSEDDLAKANGVLDDLRAATGAVSWETFKNCEEMIYAQKFVAPSNHHLFLFRLPSDGAEQLESAAKGLMALVEKYSEGKIAVYSYPLVDAEVSALTLPDEFPFSPVVARLDDVFVLSSSRPFLEESLRLLQDGTGESMFDNPRLKQVLATMPEAEDAVAIFEGAKMFSEMRGLGEFIRQKVNEENGDDPKAERVATLLELLFDELSVPDYEVTVEYTEGYRNHTAVAGAWIEGSEETLLGSLLLGARPFENWESWVPEDAVAYSLSSGVRLHPFYERLESLLREHIPEVNEHLDKFEEFQEKIGVHLDRDVLQSFSGESVSITLPATDATGNSTQESVLALRCQAPEKIKGLLHRAVDKLNEFPAVQAQQLRIEPSEELPGFEKLEAAMLQVFNVQPVFGFQDGWMFFGSSESAIQRVLDVRAGKAPTIATSEHFQRFGIEVEGDVMSLSYSNLAENTRHMAKMIRQAGLIAPMIIGMAGAQADPEDLKPVYEIVALLPGVANVVEKFDFYEEQLSVVQPGQEANTYTKQSATLIRPPSEGDEG